MIVRETLIQRGSSSYRNTFKDKTIEQCAVEAAKEFAERFVDGETIVVKVIEENGKEWTIPVEMVAQYKARDLRQGMQDD